MKVQGPVTLLERYQRLAEISRGLASTLDLNILLDRIVAAAADLSQAQAASILLYDESKQQLYFVAATNLDEPLMRGLTVPVESSIAGWIVRCCQPIIISDVQRDSRHFNLIQEITNFKTETLLGVPMIAKDKVVGVLEALNKRDGRFTQEDQDVLIALSAQAAVAIENARLFQQSDLIAEMVHELRTPLTSLNSAASMLARPDLPDDKRQQVTQIIQSEALRLSEMASTFLDFARLESGRVQFNQDVFNLGELLEECLQMIDGKAGELGIHLSLDLPLDLPAVKADSLKIKQVILNLLTNAIKYNRPGGNISMLAGTNREMLYFRVADTGIGIHPDDLPHLFDKFYRVKSSENVAVGTGLGLAICKRIVEAHGGHIEVRSELGKGAAFTVNLPRKSG